MVRLWLFLNPDVSEADLYREFYQDKNFKKVDYRIFNEGIQTVEKTIENAMEEKLINQGFNRIDIKELIKEIKFMSKQERIPYEDIKPILDF